MKVYITKYLFTQGIYEIEAKEISPTMVEDINSKWTNYYHEGDYHHSYEEAVSIANKMKESKIKSLEKQIQKIKKLSF